MQQKRTLWIGRIICWWVLALSVLIIFYIPSKAAQPPPVVLYPLLLILSVTDLAFMKYMDSRVTQARANGPRPEAAPIILAAFSACPAVYGMLWHFLGGTRTQSLSFLLISLIGYVLFTILTVKYASLGNDGSG